MKTHNLQIPQGVIGVIKSLILKLWMTLKCWLEFYYYVTYETTTKALNCLKPSDFIHLF